MICLSYIQFFLFYLRMVRLTTILQCSLHSSRAFTLCLRSPTVHSGYHGSTWMDYLPQLFGGPYELHLSFFCPKLIWCLFPYHLIVLLRASRTLATLSNCILGKIPKYQNTNASLHFCLFNIISGPILGPHPIGNLLLPCTQVSFGFYSALSLAHSATTFRTFQVIASTRSSLWALSSLEWSSHLLVSLLSIFLNIKSLSHSIASRLLIVLISIILDSENHLIHYLDISFSFRGFPIQISDSFLSV